MYQDSDTLLTSFSQNDPKQLKQIIEALINKSKILIQNLQQTWQKLQQSQTQKTFWKESYFNLRDSCQNYVDSNGMAPFNYISSLEDELKKQKVHKSCLQQKFKVMFPKRSPKEATTHARSRIKQTTGMPVEYMNLSQQKVQFNRSNSSTFILKENGGELKLQNKHKIGPKSIELFKFREQKLQQQQ